MARKRGRGMAACWYGIARTATVDRAGAWAEIDDGGSAKVVTGVTEIGEGILTVLAQIAAQEMGVKPEHVVIGDNDTARSPEAAHAGASRQTYMIGNVVALARAKPASAWSIVWPRSGRCRRSRSAPATARSGPRIPTTASPWAKR